MKINVWVCTKYLKSKVEKIIDLEDDLGIDIDDWKMLPETEQSRSIKEFIDDSFMYEWGYEEIEDEG